jgi:hypothetical protein
MLAKLFNRLSRTVTSYRQINPEPEKVVTFSLNYGKVSIGMLHYAGGIWRFEYSDEYRQFKPVLPIVDFSNIDRTYEQRVLWPFFAARIPGYLPNESDKTKDAAELLKLYGRRSINNPYELVALA